MPNGQKSKPKKKVKGNRFLAIKPDIMRCYPRHADINQYLDYVSHRYSSFVTLHTIGVTYEQRQVKAVEIDWCCRKNQARLGNHVNYRNDSATNRFLMSLASRRNFVCIEGGTHAREWLTISVALNCIDQLTAKNSRHRTLLENLRFFIVPVVNPDGYEYTHSQNPRWRKNRRPIEGSESIGIDCNRNYDFFWEGGQAKKFRGTYKGVAPFSESETQAMRNVLLALAPNLLFFLSLHSHAQSILYPWGCSKELPNVWPYLQKIAIAGREAIRKHTGRRYKCGSIANVTNRLIPGSVVDYAFGIIKVPLALVMELPGVEYGFQPPPNLIQQLGDESWVGIREMCRTAFAMAPVLRETIDERAEIDRERLINDLSC